MLTSCIKRLDERVTRRDTWALMEASDEGEMINVSIILTLIKMIRLIKLTHFLLLCHTLTISKLTRFFSLS